MTSKALLTVSIGPVHAFIAQARRIADQWAASQLLSRLASTGIQEVLDSEGEMVFPYFEGSDPPEGLPNRFVCRVPRDRANEIGKAIARAIRTEWARLVESAVEEWEVRLGQTIDPRIWQRGEELRQTDTFLDVAWSWVPEGESYSEAMDAGAQRYEASRLFRPFDQRDELGEKCALCGERTALPNGVREDVRDAWEEAYAKAAKRGSGAYFRENQARLCLVCFTKRIYPFLVAPERDAVQFGDFESIGMSEKERKEAETRPDDSEEPKLSKLPYFALVFMDGDEIGKMLRQGPGDLKTGKVEDFHRALSMALTEFAGSLRTEGSPELNVGGLELSAPPEKAPQLVYAGGEDVVFYCHPRDAFPLARAVRESFQDHMSGPSKFLPKEPTISAGVLFAHARRPAGLSSRDAQRLLDEKAKKQAGRNAVALRLDKRSGPAVEAAFKWDSKLRKGLDDLSNALRDRDLASRTTYRFTDEERILGKVFEQDEDLWRTWLTRRLSVSGEVEESKSEDLAGLLTPFLTHGHPEALRIARFLGREVPHPPPEEDKNLEETS